MDLTSPGRTRREVAGVASRTSCTDQYERADITSNTYYDWLLEHAFQFVLRRRLWASS